MRFDSVQEQLPAQVLAIHFAHVGHEEGILLSSFADVRIDPFHSPPQCLHGQNPPDFRTIAHMAEFIVVRLLSRTRLLLWLNLYWAIKWKSFGRRWGH